MKIRIGDVIVVSSEVCTPSDEIDVIVEIIVLQDSDALMTSYDSRIAWDLQKNSIKQKDCS